MKHIVLLFAALSIFICAEPIENIALFNSDLKPITVHKTSGKVTQINTLEVSYNTRQFMKLDVIVKIGNEVREFTNVTPGSHVINETFSTPQEVEIDIRGFVFDDVEAAIVRTLLDADISTRAVKAPKKPYGNLNLRVHQYKQGKAISFIGVNNVNFKGNFNAATFTARTNGNVSVKLAAVNANGKTKEINLFNKKVKKGETYLVNHKPIKSTGIFVVTTTVKNAKAPKNAKNFGAGVLSYAVIRRETTNAAPKKPYGNLNLVAHQFKSGKSISFEGLANINFKGKFNTATFTAKVDGNVVVKVAAINANGTTKEVNLFNKRVKKGETYLVNHKPIKSTGMFVVSVSVKGAKAPKNAKKLGAGVLSYAVVK